MKFNILKNPSISRKRISNESRVFLQNCASYYLFQIMIFIFLAVVYILLINLLIAMMGDTYCFVAEIKNEWMRQWARTVLITERGIPPAERLRQQDLYAERMSTGEKALVLKQTMTVSFLSFYCSIHTILNFLL